MEDENKEVNEESELEFNREKREEYETLMKDSSSNLDGYWDKSNSFVKIFLLVLLVIIALGALYYFFMYLSLR